MKEVGKITHYFSRIGVAVVEVEDEIKEGDLIEISGKSEPFRQKVGSMQVEHQQIKVAKPGMAIGLKVEKPVKVGDRVYKVEE